ncbi:hypothetical protein LCGC14_3088980 [marine sediment metagenome]|uniref:Uncharacterized protein n=1 Tax=marine sediment metagenome TaxID=412755 RepID=A0A0F8Z1L6_9ZZZZ
MTPIRFRGDGAGEIIAEPTAVQRLPDSPSVQVFCAGGVMHNVHPDDADRVWAWACEQCKLKGATVELKVMS